MDKYDSYFLEKSISYKGKKVAITGATGTLGFYIAYFLLLKDAELILVGRNKTKLQITKDNLLSSFRNAKIKCIVSDASNMDNTIKLAKELKNIQIDYLFNNAGCYHLPVNIKNGHDITYQTNYLAPLYLTKYLSDRLKNVTIVQTTSIAYKFNKLNFDDIERIRTKNKTKRYGNSKRLLTLDTLLTQDWVSNPIYLAHPGISATSLFSAKSGFGKFFSKLIVPIMNKIFMNPKKAALSIVLAPSFKYKKEKLIGPSGLLQIWGYPKEHKLKIKSFKNKEIEAMKLLTKEF